MRSGNKNEEETKIRITRPLSFVLKQATKTILRKVTIATFSLSELEICPNIKPNTGPAGGGDGKTDADTALGWYIGYETAKSDQSLAFAISAKKTWETKLNQDLEKISKTGRKFTQTYFITNRYVKTDKRKKT